MARFNTGARTLTVTGTTTLTYAFTGGIITLSGAGGYTFQLVSPVFFPGSTQHIYNATAVACTIATPNGQLRGNGFTANNQQTIQPGAFYSIVSDGTNYVISNSNGGPLNSTTLTLATHATAPIVQGSESNAGTLTIRGTSSATKSTHGVSFTDGITSTSTTTGSVRVTGGVGVSENLWVGGYGRISDGTASTSTSTGALVVTGGLGVGGRINATDFTGTIGANTRSAGSFTTVTANAQVTMTQNATSSSTTTGSLVVTGGVGISENLWVGGYIDAVSIQDTPIGTVTRNSGAFTTLQANGQVTFTANTGSTSTASGTIVVSGGVGISQNCYVGGIGRVADGTASSSTSTGAFVVSGGIGAGGTSYFPTLVCSSLTETSSIALKENVSPIDNALDTILQLCGVTYDRKDTKCYEAGLIAEDVNKVLPHLVKKDAKGNPESIMYSKLTAYLVEAVKSLNEEIKELKRK